MSLAGKIAVVAGASGIVGGGLAKRFLEEGAVVVAPVRSDASKAKVQAALSGVAPGRLHTPVLDVHSLAGSGELGQLIADQFAASIDHVISISGGMEPAGVLSSATPNAVDEAVHEKLSGHICLAKALVPLLKEDSAVSYTVVTGMLGEVCPWPEAALTAIGNAATYGLVAALQAELRDQPQRVNELRIGCIVRRDEAEENPGFPGVPAAPVSALATFVMEKIVNADTADSVVRATEAELQA